METKDTTTSTDIFNLPELNYAFNALEPYIDARTMEIHYGKHHKAYVTNLNKAIINTDAEQLSIEGILSSVSRFSETVRNNAGGHYNHSLFWKIMSPHAGGSPNGKLHAAIKERFGSFQEFKTAFAEAATKRFGSGWAWLIHKDDGTLEIVSTPNQDNPLMDVSEVKGFPLLGIDVWEHAYYLKYQSARPDYISSWWHVVNWNEVEKRFLTGLK
ncbi:MAG: superoxide dismutase [Bacteroidia bacterium]|nr:superoxide dismutase [Bacteroidia bacterium]